MSTPDTASSRHKINPATCSREELLRHLSTDPATGLSAKEAEKRLQRRRASPLHGTTAQGFSAYLKRAFREPVLWILAAVSVIALFFDRVPLGLVCLLLTVGYTVFCAILGYRAARIDAAMQSYDAPLSHVLRGRRVRRVGAIGIVRGDILLLYPGDILPADCRLLRTDHFAVRERELIADAGRPAVLLEKDAEALPDGDGNFRISPVNMAFAGAVAEEGFAIAVVISTGSDTHLGGLLGTVPPRHGKRVPAARKTLAHGSSRFNLILVASLIPLVAIGILTLHDRCELLDIFLSTLALSALALTEHTLLLRDYIAAYIRRSVAVDRDTANSADIKSTADAETLSRLTDVFLVGTAALHDGMAHPITLQTTGADDTAGALYHCDRPEADSHVRIIAELVCFHTWGRATLPASDPVAREFYDLSDDLRTLVPALCEWAEVDMEALRVRARDNLRVDRFGVSLSLSPVPEDGTVPPADVRDPARTVITLTDDPAALPAASNAEEVAMEEAYIDARREGYRILFVVTTPEGQTPSEQGRIRAMLTYAPGTCPKIAGTIKSMEAAGIRVAAFLPTVSEENIRLFTACGLSDPTPSYRCRPGDTTPAVTLLSGGVRAFEGCPESYIEDCIRTLRASGRTVAVLSVDAADWALSDAADLTVTCSPSLYAAAEEGIPAISSNTPDARAATEQDGLPHSIVADDPTRRRADVIIRRTTRTGGGICGLRRAILAADRMRDTYDAVSSYLLLSWTARALATLLAMCMGLVAIPAPLLLLSGLVVDTGVVLAMARRPLAEIPAPRKDMPERSSLFLLSHRPRLITLAITATIPWIIALVSRLLGSDFGGGLAGYGFLTITAFSLAVFAAGLPADTTNRRRTDRLTVFTFLFLLLVCIGAVAATLAAGLSPVRALFFPFIGPLLYFIAVKLLDRLT